MHTSIASLALVLAANLSAGPAPAPVQAKPGPASGSYTVDPEHTSVLLRVKHLNTSWTYCRFDKVSGAFTVDPAHLESSSFKVQIDASSIDTGQTARDAHLKSPDFLDAGQFKEISFTSKSIQKAGEGKYKAEGELSLHGVKKSLSVELEEVGTSDTKFGVRAGFHGSFMIQRSDYGIKFMPDAVGEEIHVTVSVEGTRVEAKAK